MQLLLQQIGIFLQGTCGYKTTQIDSNTIISSGIFGLSMDFMVLGLLYFMRPSSELLQSNNDVYHNVSGNTFSLCIKSDEKSLPCA